MLPRRFRAAAFSLVELLVVLLVIAVLVSIALPALRSARESARSVRCLTNLRSLGQAVAMYRDCSKDLLPVAEQEADVRVAYLEPFAALSPHLDAPLPAIDAAGRVRSSPPFRCPSDGGRWETMGFSYYYTPCDLFPFWWPGDPQRGVTLYLSQDPRVVLMIDGEPFHGPPRVGASRNVLLLDGTAQPWAQGLRLGPRY